MVGTNGSECHSDSGPVGATSVWPAKHTSGPVVPRRAHRLVTSPNGIDSQRKPIRSRRLAISCWQPPSSGVTDLRAMSSLASSSVPPACPSGIHVDLEVVEGTIARSGARRSFLLLRRGRGGGRPAGARVGDFARGRLVDEPKHVGRGV